MSKHRRLDERENQTYRLVVLFLADTGVRFGELTALRVSRLDMTSTNTCSAIASTKSPTRSTTPRSEASRSAAAVANSQNPAVKVLPNADVVDLAAKGKTAGQHRNSRGAPGEIRTRAPASGGRCSIP
jgi:hypothetical protein